MKRNRLLPCLLVLLMGALPMLCSAEVFTYEAAECTIGGEKNTFMSRALLSSFDGYEITCDGETMTMITEEGTTVWHLVRDNECGELGEKAHPSENEGVVLWWTEEAITLEIFITQKDDDGRVTGETTGLITLKKK